MAVTSPASHTVTPGLRSARRIESHRSAPLSQWSKGARGRGPGPVACDSDGVRSTRRPRPPDGASRPSHTTSRPPRPLPVMPGLSPSSYRASVLRSLPVNDPFLRPPPCLPRIHTPAPAPVRALRHPHPHTHAGTAEGAWKGWGGGGSVGHGGRQGRVPVDLFTLIHSIYMLCAHKRNAGGKTSPKQ